jgi:hypothetical protein
MKKMYKKQKKNYKGTRKKKIQGYMRLSMESINPFGPRNVPKHQRACTPPISLVPLFTFNLISLSLSLSHTHTHTHALSLFPSFLVRLLRFFSRCRRMPIKSRALGKKSESIGWLGHSLSLFFSVSPILDSFSLIFC